VHMNNRESCRKLAVTVDGTTIPTPGIQLTMESRLIANSPPGRTGLNEREAPGKVVTASHLNA